MTPYKEIRNRIEEALRKEGNKFVIYPYGEMGIATKQILNECFGLEESLIIDNKLCKFNSKIKSLDDCKDLNTAEFQVLFTCANSEIYDEVYKSLTGVFPPDRIIEIFKKKEEIQYTKCGKYSYGSLCNHNLVETVGSFCSFAQGVDAVANHAINYITSHPFIYNSSSVSTFFEKAYSGYRNEPWYFEGVVPKSEAQMYKLKKTRIGSDVWLGRNVLITNGANIGNGVVAGAGAVITKDVPDYAVVGGGTGAHYKVSI